MTGPTKTKGLGPQCPKRLRGPEEEGDLKKLNGSKASKHETSTVRNRNFRLAHYRLDENAEERTARGRFRTEIAHETIFRPNLHVTGCAICIVNED